MNPEKKLEWIILARYVKSGKEIWWKSYYEHNDYQIGKQVSLPGTITDVEIVDVIVQERNGIQ